MRLIPLVQAPAPAPAASISSSTSRSLALPSDLLQTSLLTPTTRNDARPADYGRLALSGAKAGAQASLSRASACRLDRLVPRRALGFDRPGTTSSQGQGSIVSLRS